MRQRRLTRDEMMQVPGAAIAAVKNGQQVRLTGRAVALGPLRKSPLSQRDCIGFRLTVDSRYGGDWHRVFDQEEFETFILADGSGEAVLHAPFRMELDPYQAASEIVPEALYDLLKQKGANITMFGTRDLLRYFETLLLPGDEIIAVGRATIEIDPGGQAPSHREPPVMCHLRGDGERVVIADAAGTSGGDEPGRLSVSGSH